MKDDASGEINGAILRLAAGAEHDGDLADFLGVLLLDIAAFLSDDVVRIRCFLELVVIAQHAVVAALSAHHRAERLERRAVLDGLLCHLAALFRRALADEVEHVRCELERNLREIGRAVALEHVHRLHDLDAVADAVAERRVHVRNQRNRAAASALADVDHRLRELDGVIERLHERARTRLDVEQNAIGTCRELLAHDGGCNQRDAVDRRRDVAQRIELLVGRCEVAGLADEGDAAFVDRIEEFLAVKHRAIARNGFELVDRAARMAEAATGHLRNFAAAGSDDRRDDQRRLVADAARRMFVDLLARDGGEVNHVAGLRHDLRELRDFMVVHAVEPDGHEHRGHLIIRDVAFDIAVNHVFDFGVRKGFVVLLLRDQVVHAHDGIFLHFLLLRIFSN